ncbi:MAG TPA: phage major capsid protein [Polyangiaceae bacterium]|nr:phage major capsid protein [Polyangiaceae bacterium]
MATTTTDIVFQPQILTEVVQAEFSGKDAFNDSRLAQAGVAIINGSMPEGGPTSLGKKVTVPRFGVIGEFEEVAENTPGVPSAIGMESEESNITHDYLGFETTVWSQANGQLFANGSGDPYEEAARQIRLAANRRMDYRLITAAMASGVYAKTVYSASAPVTLTYDLAIDTRFEAFGDEQDDLAAIMVHSQVTKDLLKLKDGNGRPMLTSSQGEAGPLDTFAGLKVITSDRLPITGSTMSTPVSSGTSPPVLTLDGTPLGAFNLHIDCLASHASTTTVRVSTDGGNTWSEAITVADDGVPVAIIDPSKDSVIGVNGRTGLTMAFASGTFNIDNLWTSKTAMKATSILLKKNALAFWFNQSLLTLKTDQDIRRDTNEGAMHLYGVAHRYARRPGGTRAGVAHIVHNVSSY